MSATEASPVSFIKDWRWDDKWLGNVVAFDPTKTKTTQADVFVSSRVGEGNRKNVYVVTKILEDEDEEGRDVFEFEKERVHLVCLMDDGRVKWRADKYLIAYILKNESDKMHVGSLNEEIISAARHFALAGNV